MACFPQLAVENRETEIARELYPRPSWAEILEGVEKYRRERDMPSVFCGEEPLEIIVGRKDYEPEVKKAREAARAAGWIVDDYSL